MTCVLALLLTVCVAVPAVCQSDLEPRRPDQEAFLERAVFADGTLWVLSDAGVLSAITEGTATAVDVPLPEPALDLCLVHGKPAVVTRARDGGDAWTLRLHAADHWLDAATIPSKHEDLLGLCFDGARVTVLTNRRLIEVGGDTQREVVLKGSLGPGRVTSLFGTPDEVLVGTNAGEWGGGLQRVNRTTGKVLEVGRRSKGQPCAGPLTFGCDPVNGIVREPWNPQCIALAVGVVHFYSHGRIVEVCSDSVQCLYFKATEEQPPKGGLDADGEPFATIAFFGLVSRGEQLWAIGSDGLYRFGAGGQVQCTPLPEFKRIGAFDVSFALPDVVLVLTGINQRHSMSGLVPMLVPR